VRDIGVAVDLFAVEKVPAGAVEAKAIRDAEMIVGVGV
jgi:hypothetical protein